MTVFGNVRFSVSAGVVIALVVSAILVRDMIVEPNGPWNWGETLYDVAGPAWINANPQDKLTTVASYRAAIARPHDNDYKTPLSWKPEAEEVVRCIDHFAQLASHKPISKLAYQCLWQDTRITFDPNRDVLWSMIDTRAQFILVGGYLGDANVVNLSTRLSAANAVPTIRLSIDCMTMLSQSNSRIRVDEGLQRCMKDLKIQS